MTGTQANDMTLRPALPDDIHAVLALMDRCEIAEYGSTDSTLQDLADDWDAIDLERDTWLASDVHGTVVGYAAVVPWRAGARYDFFADPAWDADLDGRLLAWCQARGPAWAAEHGVDGTFEACTFLAAVNERNHLVAEQGGMQPVQYHWQMHIALDAPPPQPQWPPGVTVRPPRPGLDDRPVYELVERAFAQPGRAPASFEAWHSSMIDTELFDRELWFLAEMGGQLIGASLSCAYPGEGWVRQLAVAEPWRRRGLGRALLLHSLAAFRSRGLPSGALAVSAANAGAYALYEGVGMRRRREYIEYRPAERPRPSTQP